MTHQLKIKNCFIARCVYMQKVFEIRMSFDTKSLCHLAGDLWNAFCMTGNERKKRWNKKKKKKIKRESKGENAREFPPPWRQRPWPIDRDYKIGKQFNLSFVLSTHLTFA